MQQTSRTRIQISTKTTLKEQADQLFDSLGIDIGTAVNLFLAQSVREGGLPFRPTTVPPLEQSVLDAAAETPIYVKTLDEMKEIIHNA
jgi:DNA-damage-inducible protein J